MNFRGRSANREDPEMNMVPMIDVMMFLLIFFVLISLNVIPAFGLKTVLPDSSTAKAASSDQPPVVVSLAADGSVALDGQKMPVADLGAAAKQAHEKDARNRPHRHDCSCSQEFDVFVLTAAPGRDSAPTAYSGTEDAGTSTSRLPFDCIADTMPARSICSISRAARL